MHSEHFHFLFLLFWIPDFQISRFLDYKSRLAVDREFMYIGSAGPGRADGRTADGRTGGRQVPGHGRADGRADGRQVRF